MYLYNWKLKYSCYTLVNEPNICINVLQLYFFACSVALI